MLCYVMLCYVMLCYVMLCYVMLYVTLRYVTLHYVMLCYVMLCYIICHISKFCRTKTTTANDSILPQHIQFCCNLSVEFGNIILCQIPCMPKIGHLML